MRSLALTLFLLALSSLALSYPLNAQDTVFDERFVQLSKKILDSVLIPSDLDWTSGSPMGNSPSPKDDGRNFNRDVASALASSTVTGMVHGGSIVLNVVNTTATVLSANSAQIIGSNNATLLTVATNSSVNAANSDGVLLMATKNSTAQVVVSNSRATIITESSNGTLVLSNASLFLGSTKSRVTIAAVNSTIGIMNETSTIKVLGKNNTVTYITNLDGLVWDSGKVQNNPREMRAGNGESLPAIPEPNQDGLAWDSGKVQQNNPREMRARNDPEPNQDGLAWESDDNGDREQDHFQIWYDHLVRVLEKRRKLVRETVQSAQHHHHHHHHKQGSDKPTNLDGLAWDSKK